MTNSSKIVQAKSLFDNKIPDRATEAKTVLEVINNHHPLTLALTAPFGAGKSYLVQLIVNEIEESNKKYSEKVGYIKFNTWQYDYWNNPLLAFMDAISPANISEANKYLNINITSLTYDKLVDAGRILLFYFSKLAVDQTLQLAF